MKTKLNKSTIESALFLLACCGQTRNMQNRLRFSVPKSAGYQLIRTFRLPWKYNREAFAYLISNKERIILAFKGTSARRFDISIDLHLFQTPFPFVKKSGKTHEGVTFLYGLLRESIISTIRNLSERGDKRKLYITGYSLGGALATLAAVDLASHFPLLHPKVYTFGSPRVGDPTFVAVFNKKISESIRIVNVYDYVPLEPQTSIKHGFIYRHVKGYFPISFHCNKEQSLFTFPLLLNHRLDGYYTTLSKFIPSYAKRLAKENPKFCPPFQTNIHIDTALLSSPN